MIGIASSVAANRLSYVFDLAGPSLVVDTACSSSLVATHLACRSIWEGESELAVVGGVNTILKPELGIAFSKGGFLALDGRCKAFDPRADGYVRSEGAGVVLLKPLSRALADGDNIYATVIGSALNQDGRTAGISAPNPDAQVAVIEEACRDSGISPGDIEFVEGHGTGTAVGDPIEGNAIGAAIGVHKAHGHECIMGSLKSNLGHLEAASGVASLIKAVLALHNRCVPPNIHFETPNPAIPFDRLNLRVPCEPVPLPNSGPVLAGVNSFGFGGANAHIVLCTRPERPEGTRAEPRQTRPEALFTLSARTDSALQDLARAYTDWLPGTDTPLADICWSSSARRSAHDCRLATVVGSKEELADHLAAFTAGEKREVLSRGRSRSSGRLALCFVYSGQGPQWWGMGRELLETSELFRNAVERIDVILAGLGWLADDDTSLIAEMTRDEGQSRINETKVAQPAIFATQVGLTDIWKSCGVVPDAAVGHSLGEVTAAYASGGLSLEEATRVVFWRCPFQDRLRGHGQMLAVGLSEEETKTELARLDGEANIAAVNGPKMVVLCGALATLESLAEEWENRGVFNRFLKVDIPFHSPIIETVKDDFLTALGVVECRETDIPMYSSVAGERVPGDELAEAHWYRNMRQPVLFYPAIRQLIADGFTTFLEISPHPVLARSVDDALAEAGEDGLVVPSLRREEAEVRRMLASLGQLWTAGYGVDWSLVHRGRGKAVKLPTHPWDRARHWMETEEGRERRRGSQAHPHLAERTDLAAEPGTSVWTVNLDKRTYPYIGEHRLQGPIVYPGTGHIELAIAVGKQAFGDEFGFLEDVNFEAALFLPQDGDPPHVQLEVACAEGTYTIASRPREPGAQWAIHSRGRINHSGDRFISERVDLAAIRERLTEPVGRDALYEALETAGLQLGPSFLGIHHIWGGADGEALGEVVVPEELRDEVHQFYIHPAVLDACLQASIGAVVAGGKRRRAIYVPFHVDRAKLHRRPTGSRLWSYLRNVHFGEETGGGDIWVLDEDGQVVAEFQGFVLKYLKGSGDADPERTRDDLYEFRWQAKSRPERDLQRDAGEYLPSPLAAAGLADELTRDVGPTGERYAEGFEPALNRLCVAYIVRALGDLGLRPDPARRAD